MKKSLTLLLYKCLLIVFLVLFLEVLGYLGFVFNSSTSDYLSNKHFFQIRSMLMGNKNPEKFPRYLSLPYLGYIPYPNYTQHGIVQHNEDGYRGSLVPLLKTNKYRVLCIGGSTTYGSGVNLPTETYPAQLELLLTNYINNDSLISKTYSGAEVINAGLEAGNSADELLQYLFKYRYYHADAVVIHSGINDAIIVNGSEQHFQLDYSNYRRILFHLEPLPPLGRALLKSYFISFITIHLFYSDFTQNTNGFKEELPHTFCKWTSISMERILADSTLQYYPFFRNTSTLYNEVMADSSILFVLPTVTNNESNFVKENSMYQQIVILNNRISEAICHKLGVQFISFAFDSIQNKNSWIDDCHLDKSGEKNKAGLVFQHIKANLKTTSPPQKRHSVLSQK